MPPRNKPIEQRVQVVVGHKEGLTIRIGLIVLLDAAADQEADCGLTAALFAEDNRSAGRVYWAQNLMKIRMAGAIAERPGKNRIMACFLGFERVFFQAMV